MYPNHDLDEFIKAVIIFRIQICVKPWSIHQNLDELINAMMTFQHWSMTKTTQLWWCPSSSWPWWLIKIVMNGQILAYKRFLPIFQSFFSKCSLTTYLTKLAAKTVSFVINACNKPRTTHNKVIKIQFIRQFQWSKSNKRYTNLSS